MIWTTIATGDLVRCSNPPVTRIGRLSGSGVRPWAIAGVGARIRAM